MLAFKLISYIYVITIENQENNLSLKLPLFSRSNLNGEIEINLCT